MARNKRYRKRKLGDLAESIEPYYHHFDPSQIIDLDDDGFAYLLINLTGVNMLDLNETEITVSPACKNQYFLHLLYLVANLRPVYISLFINLWSISIMLI